MVGRLFSIRYICADNMDDELRRKHMSLEQCYDPIPMILHQDIEFNMTFASQHPHINVSHHYIGRSARTCVCMCPKNPVHAVPDPPAANYIDQEVKIRKVLGTYKALAPPLLSLLALGATLLPKATASRMNRKCGCEAGGRPRRKKLKLVPDVKGDEGCAVVGHQMEAAWPLEGVWAETKCSSVWQISSGATCKGECR